MRDGLIVRIQMPYKNKEDQKACAKRFYHTHKEQMKARAIECTKVSRPRNKEYIKEYLRSHPCVDCGNSDIRVLDFDHVYDSKHKCVSTMAQNGSSLGKIKKEIEKCEVRCANCHRIVTYERRLSRDNLM